MSDGHALSDYEALKPARGLRSHGDEDSSDSFSVARITEPRLSSDGFGATHEDESEAHGTRDARRPRESAREKRRAERERSAHAERWVARRGHFVTYVGLFLFTFFVLFRPYELFSIGWLTRGAEVLAIFTLIAYFPTQFALEGNITARPREVVFALLLLLTAFLSVPFSISVSEAWENFLNFSKVILMFVVMANVVRTEGRLRGMFLLAIAASVILSYAAFSDFRSGRLHYDGERVRGLISGLFGNPNDLALHLATMTPLVLGLAFSRRNHLLKIFYALCAALFVAGVVVTFSRGGFLGLVLGAGVVAWKLGRKHRILVVALAFLTLATFVVASPGGYGDRIKTVVGGDALGSAYARQALFWRSALVALRYPVFGVGIGNFRYKGQHNQVSHNAYTQVAAEMGIAALAFYVLLMWTSLKHLRRIESESLASKDRAKFYYLSVGLQGSLVAYMVSSFFASVAHLWYVYYIVGYAVCLRRLYALEREASQASDADASPNPNANAQGIADPERAHARP